MFVGLPITSAILHVFAATNSPTKYGIGLTRSSLQKQQMKGVNVSTTISFDVKMVSTDTSAYSDKKSFIWLPRARLSIENAKRRKKPSSSKYTDKNVKDKNNVKILIGFISPDAVKPCQSSLGVNSPNASKSAPPAKAGSQKILIL